MNSRLLNDALGVAAGRTITTQKDNITRERPERSCILLQLISLGRLEKVRWPILTIDSKILSKLTNILTA